MAIWTPILMLAAAILPVIALVAVVAAFGLLIRGWVDVIRERRSKRAEVVQHKPAPAATPTEPHIAEPRIA